MAIDSTEMQLIKKARSGDDASFELLIQNCKTKAYNTALRFLRNEEDAMDALQESFIKIFRHLDQFKGDCKFDTWVYRIVVNTCHDILRKKRIHKTECINKFYEEGERMSDIIDPAPSPATILDTKETVGYILDCLNKMNIDQREVIILRDIQGFSYDEISEILDCTLGTVKSRINRARVLLREMITEHKENECV